MTTGPVRSSDPTDPCGSADSASLHGDLLAARALVFGPCGLACSQAVPEAESADYAAHAFALDGRSVRFRVAKTTPTKVGQFVTVWKRSPAGPIAPFDTADGIDLVVVSCRDGQHAGRFGQFVFPVGVLRRHGVVSENGSGGKRGFRVYPPWVTTTNSQAGRAQTWQLDHFLYVPEDGTPLDLARARALYGR
ncbi:MepB family protein [Streptomyces sp. NBC_00233]|uniref:MepB family protein n=1 Tax=Streptomyces sp. NBC_00233 TaxID=2975686 RepID=UPI00225A3A45|nr:MepB family protein [Streptomyces sp. NBC_00233]MCX5226658.1 MepB family protein [Streptomyces sp. NBC_00233]